MLRHHAPDTTVEITTRTVRGEYLLRPSEELNEIILGILGRAQLMYGIWLHLFVFMSNHYHLIATIPDAKVLADFACYLNGNLAREANRQLGREGPVWSRRYRSIEILDDVAMVDRAHYLTSHGCKEGLVGRPIDWPGATSVQALLTGEPARGFWFDRAEESYHRNLGRTVGRYDFATSYDVQLSPLPCWDHLTEAERVDRVAALVAQIEEETRVQNLADERTPHGPAAVLAQDPYSHPENFEKRPAPPCHTAVYSLREAFITTYYAFVDAYTEASAQFRSGHLDTEFPADCFPPPLPFYKPVTSFAPS